MKSSAGFLFTFTTLKGGYFLGGAKFSGKSCLVCHEVEYYCAYNLAFLKALRVQNKAIILWSCHLVVVEPHTFALKMIPHDIGGRLCLSPSHPLNLRVSPTFLRRGGKPKTVWIPHFFSNSNHQPLMSVAPTNSWFSFVMVKWHNISMKGIFYSFDLKKKHTSLGSGNSSPLRVNL